MIWTITSLAGSTLAQSRDVGPPPPSPPSEGEYEVMPSPAEVPPPIGLGGEHGDLLSSASQIDAEGQLSSGQLPIEAGWWDAMVGRQLRSDAAPASLTLEQVLMRTLVHSKQIRVFSELPLIRETAITEADAAFDWNAFLEARWDDTSDPIGSALTAGPGISRFRDNKFSASAGVRRRNYVGGQIEVRQDFGWQDNNSTFFVPAPQGSARLALNYTQPLLRGKGECYNTSLIVLAQLDQRIADVEFQRQLQSHLLEVTRSYWALYLERGVLYQRLNTYRRAEEIVMRLEKRVEIDAAEIQVKAARAALTERKADLVRAQSAVKNAEAKMRALVNDPELGNWQSTEIIPLDGPIYYMVPVDMEQSLAEAVQFRPELEQALKQIQSGAVRLNMSKHELLPVLNLVTEVYVAGLAANGNTGQAWVNQFNQGEPGYSVGLQFEVPLGNRAACARNQRRYLEFRQLQNQYQVALQTVGLEVEVAVREVQTSQQELGSKGEAILARQDQLIYLEKRWERLPGADVAASLMLENILTAQDRLAQAENEFLVSQITYSLSLTNLKKATGTLLQHEMVSISRSHDGSAPVNVADKPELTSAQGGR